MIVLNEKSKSAKEIMRSVPCGFQMTFKNGNTISVQFGFGNYCENRQESKMKCPNAEVAIWDISGKWYNFEDDTVKGYCHADEVAKWINFAANSEI
jgi:hypothetical protein